ncbi:MAG: GNAT family N-acetyltransferase [Rhizobiales bacterium]|nr:GNAT family N-acetyltransferase [Hyphomicrobiales bacterium]
MMNPTASAFSDAAWMRAVLAHVPRASTLVNGTEGGPFGLFAARESLLPLAHLQSVTTALTPCPLPSVTRNISSEEAAHFLNELGEPLVLRGVPADHPVAKALIKGAGHVHVLKTWQRAALDLSGDFESWMSGNFDHKRRKELKRLKSRLAEQGELVLDELGPGGDLSPHISAFLMVEASGWKGDRGTAIASDAGAAKGLVAGLAAMHRESKVRFWTLRLNGLPIASLFALVNDGDAVLGKIGYDQNFAKFSPGVLLIIEATRCLFEERLLLVDSNAIPDHPMIDRIWRDRITCMDVVIAGSEVGVATFGIIARYHAFKDAARAMAKQLYLGLTGRRAS